ncbi:MAG: hypothetical protein IJ423_00455 [Clostridia bacterium]|nr:hypothetical protein [Clostridia bacterium]
MTNSKSTKKALLTSSMSILICFAMLLGTTFAWFTDSAVSANNVIKSGNLDVDVEYTLGDKDTSGEFVWKPLDRANDLFQKGLWEPGHTEVVALKIKNNGTLALKYAANMNIVSETIGKTKDNKDIVLSDILTVSTLSQQANDAMGVGNILLNLAFTGENAGGIDYSDPVKFKSANILSDTDPAKAKLEKGEEHYVIIKVDMAETVGNEANHDGVNIPTIEFGINVLATQYTSESDSFGNQYDKDATYAVTNADALKNIITDDEVTNAKIDLANGNYDTNFKVDGGKNLTIEGNGKDTVLSGQIATTSSNEGTLILKNMTIKVDDSIADSTGISQTGKSAIAIWGNQTVICENVTFDMSLKDSTAITSWWDTGVGTTIIVRNCTFYCNGQRPIRATGNVTVENCTFNDPYRYAVQLTAKSSTATEMNKAIINFKNNTIVNGASGKAFVYGIQLEGSDYGCHDCVINGAGNTIVDGGADSTMYYCECGKVDHNTIEWNVETTPVHEG